MGIHGLGGISPLYSQSSSPWQHSQTLQDIRGQLSGAMDAFSGPQGGQILPTANVTNLQTAMHNVISDLNTLKTKYPGIKSDSNFSDILTQLTQMGIQTNPLSNSQNPISSSTISDMTTSGAMQGSNCGAFISAAGTAEQDALNLYNGQ